MKTFIQLVAEDIIKRYGADLRRVVIVFPNKRASLFMSRALARAAKKPVWAPRYETISELFEKLSPYSCADRMAAVCTLYNVYAGQMPRPESLDLFYGWGEIMLNDFDDIDKNLADAKKIFKNVASIKELDRSDFLTAEQEEALRRFFADFSLEDNSKVKERFLELWNKMHEIYCGLKSALQAKGMLYEGALYRDVVEHLDERLGGKAENTYAFVGFNALNKSEDRLLSYLQTNSRTLFYWDYDVMYMKEGNGFEAGAFIRQNMAKYPNALPESCFDNLSRPPKIEYIASATENAQARHIPQWLKTHLTKPEDNTAIVLCNESLLQPVLHSLPDAKSELKIRQANITMGFPMSNTPAFGFVNALLSLQTGYDRSLKRFNNEDLLIATSHPYYKYLKEDDVLAPHDNNKEILCYIRKLLEKAAQAIGQQTAKKHDSYGELYNEALYRAHEIATRFELLVEDGTLTVQPTTLRRLIRNVMSTTKIPFHGEPAAGVQVMGMLETRNLNFRHILVLSANEGLLPRTTKDTSFVPLPLRRAFGLSTPKQETTLYAYTFYRLLQRAEHVTLMYNISTEGGTAKEPSRFLRQLLAETNIEIKSYILQSGQSAATMHEIKAEKTAEVMEKLKNKYAATQKNSRPLSPSALNAYLDCPLKFFFQQIADIRKPDQTSNKPDAAMFGTIFHRAAELALKELARQDNTVRAADIKEFLDKGNAGLRRLVEKSFMENFFLNQPDAAHYNGQLIVVREVLTNYLRQLLKHDCRLNEFTLTGTEETHSRKIEVTSGSERLTIKVGGKIDRLDTVRQPDKTSGQETLALRVVDYKTGGSPQQAKEMREIITRSDKRPSYIFQIFLYAWVMTSCQNLPVTPALFFVNKAYKDDYDPRVKLNKVPVTDFGTIASDFESVLQETLAELFNPNIPFLQTETPKKCEHCDYKGLCRK